MNLFKNIYTVLGQMSSLIDELSPEQYRKPCEQLSRATIGQHTRHIVELFQALVDHYESGTVNYDARPRNRDLENDPAFAANIISELIGRLEQPDKHMVLISVTGTFETNYYRELLYNLEHCIHHQALIRVALKDQGAGKVPDSFGVAPSTLIYRQQCAQ